MAVSQIYSIANEMKNVYSTKYFQELEALLAENDARLYREFEEEMKWKEFMNSGSASCTRVIEEVKNLKWLIDNYDGTPVEKEVINEACLNAKAAMNELGQKMFPQKIR